MDLWSLPIYPLKVCVLRKEKKEIDYLLPLTITKVASYLKVKLPQRKAMQVSIIVKIFPLVIVCILIFRLLVILLD